MIADSFDLPGGSSAVPGFGSGAGGNEDLAARHTGTLAGTLSYVQTDTTKAASAHSISGNRLTIARVAGATAFQLSSDGSSGRDLGIQPDLVTGNTISVFKRIDADSHSGAADINTSIRTGLPAGVPVEVRVVMEREHQLRRRQNHLPSLHQGTLSDSGNISFANDSRYLIFDTARIPGRRAMTHSRSIR